MADKKNKKKQDDDDGDGDHKDRFFDFCSLNLDQKKALAAGTNLERNRSTVPLSSVKTEQVLKVEPMTLFEQIVCIIFLGLGVPNGVLTIPLVTTLIGYFVLGNIARAFQILFVLLLPLAIMPQTFVPAYLHSYMAHLIIKYFSFRFAYDERPLTQEESNTPHRPQILVAPPHGVFPYGNILSMLVWPSLSGHHFMGLAANAALRVFPILKNIGVVDASPKTARRSLENYPHTIGISTGGVAEVFETNSHDEVIVLKERIGLIKLAIRTGADLVPCYVFGNTKLLSCWFPGDRATLEKWSRKMGFALILFHGRFGLPIPYRVPVFGATGKPVVTAHLQCEDPTMEQIKEIQDKLIVAMSDVFDKYKGLYGWEDKELIIK
jgi:hypothetical protein